MSDLDYQSQNSQWNTERPFGARPGWAEALDRTWDPYDLNDQMAHREISLRHAGVLLPILGWFQYLVAFSGFGGAIYFFIRYADSPSWLHALGFLMVAGWGPAIAICLLLQAYKAGCRTVIRSAE